jgi:hypothetical protein
LCHRCVNRMEQRDCCPVIRHIEGGKNHGNTSASLILIPLQFLELFRDVSMDANDPVIHAHIVFASFSSISARGQHWYNTSTMRLSWQLDVTVFTARQMNPLPKVVSHPIWYSLCFSVAPPVLDHY